MISATSSRRTKAHSQPSPILISADHFTRYAPEHIEYGVNRYQNETRRLYGVLDKHLSSNNIPYLTGDKCTIAGTSLI